MNRTLNLHASTLHRGHATPFLDSIEWEELPSLADSLTQRQQPPGQQQAAAAARSALATAPTNFNSAWTDTLPAELVELAMPASPFCETLRGLVMREVHEPDVFRHFFG